MTQEGPRTLFCCFQHMDLGAVPHSPLLLCQWPCFQVSRQQVHWPLSDLQNWGSFTCWGCQECLAETK